MGKGKVYLVGAGPGDPGLITLKAIECLSKADVVVYDNLANRVFLKYVPENAELIYAGKKGGNHTLSQDKINKLIVDRALQGKRVVRLKGGDPFIFGRGGEEAEELAKVGVAFEVIPGVTSAISVPAYAGIPLTHRNYSSTVAFITGHEDPTKDKSGIAWDKIAPGIGTLVFLMGVGNLPKIAEALMAHGRDPSTPVAVIRRGTGPDQQTVVASLDQIAEKVSASGITPPAIIVVGEVVGLRGQLNWFETKPLFGRRIIVTRAREQASEFSRRLAELGAECIEFPTIQVVPPGSWEVLDRAIYALADYEWVVFTSANGVKFFLERLRALGKDVRALSGIRIAAIGPKTAKVWQELGIEPDLVPGEYRAEAVVEGFRSLGVIKGKILIPRAAKAREILAEELRKMGLHVDVVPAYETVRPTGDVDRVKAMLQKRQIHMVTFTSSSTVSNFVEMFGSHKPQLLEWMESVAVACIGPITAQTAKEHGFSVNIIPEQYTIEAFTDKIKEWFSSR